MRQRTAWIIVASMTAWTPLPAAAVPQAGKATTVVLDVRAVDPIAMRELIVNEDVFKDDTVVTGDRSAARLAFVDGSFLSMGPNGSVTLKNLPIYPEDKREFVTETSVGVFKFVTGQLDSSAYKLETPVGTIGVRGTILLMYVHPDGTTEAASMHGQVIPCTSECVVLDPWTYTVLREGRPPEPPGPVPAEFYERVRDMTRRLLLAEGVDTDAVNRAFRAAAAGQPAAAARYPAQAFRGSFGISSLGVGRGGPATGGQVIRLPGDAGPTVITTRGTPIPGPASTLSLMVGLVLLGLLISVARGRDRRAALRPAAEPR